MTQVVSMYASDQDIITGIKNFDDRAVSNLYRKHKEYCLRFMNSMVDDEDGNKDIYQDAIIIFIENLRHKNLELVNTSIQTYLNSICRNQVLARRKKAQRTIMTGGQEELEFDSIDEIIIEDPRILLIKEELDRMQEKGRACFELLRKVFFEKRSHADIAVLLNYTNTNSVKTQSYKCREQLEKQVKKRLAHV